MDLTTIENTIKVWTNVKSDYILLDSGNRQKLEQIGEVLIVRSEPRAWWAPTLPISQWEKASATYTREERGEWQFKNHIPKDFVIEIGGFKAKINFTKTSKHIGIFPEQSQQWAWIQNITKAEKRTINVLNLFGYTGFASLAAASAGAKVTHVDASKLVVSWARENQVLCKLEQTPIRWIVDDVLKFVKRERNRGKKYDAIILDPPAYGRGAQGQVWKIEKDLVELLAICKDILSEDPLFIFLTTYSIESSSLAIGNLLQDLMRDYKGKIETGEMALKHQGSEKLLPMSIFAVWRRD